MNESRSSGRASRCRAWLAALLLASGAAPAGAAQPPLAALTPIGPAELVFTPKRDACDGNDVPDTPARAFRDADGQVVLFAMHDQNRAFRGPDFKRLKLSCHSPLPSDGTEDPAAFDDASWIAATWTEDGRRVAALVHHEYQGNTHPGRCPAKNYMACWYNSVVAVASDDGGRNFRRPSPPQVVATPPFRQDVGQGRHRGFFNPSNIVADGRSRYMMAGTTGWNGQDSGVCLFRSLDLADPAGWRAYDGAAFTARFDDPYRGKPGTPTCRPIAPFPTPVGSISRHRATGVWISVFQAKADGRDFVKPGFYATSSRDLLVWDTPRLLVEGPTLYDDPCASGGQLIAYPSLIDPEARGRNFDDVSDRAELYYARLKVEGCNVTSERDLLRLPVAIKVWP
jgi:hypothetical protein